MTKSSSQITFEEMSQTEQRDKSLFSPYEDLAFTMYVDLEVQDLIRKMDHKKQEAVLGEYTVWRLDIRDLFSNNISTTPIQPTYNFFQMDRVVIK